MAEPRVAILGAGVAGLYAGLRLARRGLDVTVFEQEDQPGGMARSFQSLDRPLDRFYHYLNGVDAEAVQVLAAELPEAPVRWRVADVGVLLGGRLYNLSTPPDLLRFAAVPWPARLRLVAHLAYAGLSADPARLNHRSAEAWLRAWLGDDAYHAMWAPLLHRKFGRAAPRVSAAWIWARIHRMASTPGGHLWRRTYGFVPGGVHRLAERLAEHLRQAGGRLELSCPVHRLEVRGSRLVAVHAARTGRSAVDAVISTVPLPALGRLLPARSDGGTAWPPAYDMLPVRVLVLRLAHRLSSCFWLNTNDPHVRLAGLIEYTNLDMDCVGPGQSLVYVPFYGDPDDPVHALDADGLVDVVAPVLGLVQPAFTPGWILERHAFADRWGQSVCAVNEVRDWTDGRTPYANLLTTDATQLHPHDRSLDGSLAMGRRAADGLMPRLRPEAR